MRHLGNGVVDIGNRHYPHANQTVGRDCAIFLGEPIVVAADHCPVDIVMADVAPKDRPRDHCREQDFGIEPVFILLFDALLGRARAGGIRHLETKGLPGPLGAAGAQIQEIRLQ